MLLLKFVRFSAHPENVQGVEVCHDSNMGVVVVKFHRTKKGFRDLDVLMIVPETLRLPVVLRAERVGPRGIHRRLREVYLQVLDGALHQEHEFPLTQNTQKCRTLGKWLILVHLAGEFLVIAVSVGYAEAIHSDASVLLQSDNDYREMIFRKIRVRQAGKSISGGLKELWSEATAGEYDPDFMGIRLLDRS